MTSQMNPARSRNFGILAIVCLALAAATVMQASGWNQSSHYALTKSIAGGSPIIDPYRQWTGDKAKFQGHWYSSRAPGLAILSVPAYAGLELVGAPALAAGAAALKREGEATWALGLWAAVLPLALILVLVRRLGERVEPGLGTPAAIALGAGTLLLPFSTMLFSHVLSAALGFAAFALPWREREGRPRAFWLVGAGVLAGLGVAAEYPTVFVGIALGLYAISRRSAPEAAPGRRPRFAAMAQRGLAYSGGAVAGVIPLLAYNQWAFGSPTHLAYADLKAHQSGFFGIGIPNPAVAVEILFSSRGLFVLAPILLLSLVGIVLLARRGLRAEAYTITGVALAYLLYNAGYFLPFGGEVPGPRFLISALPFLGVPLALVFRRMPGPAIALALASAVVMATATITDPLIENEADTGLWGPALAGGEFQQTILSAAGLTEGWLAAAPFVLLVGAAVALAGVAAGSERLALSPRQAGLGIAAVAAWAVFAVLGPSVLGVDASAGARIVAAGGSAAPEVDHGALPLLELAALALAVAVAGLALVFAVPRASARLRARPGGRPRESSLSPAGATRA